jgi:signal recognition particle subunit SRP54
MKIAGGAMPMGMGMPAGMQMPAGMPDIGELMNNPQI